MSEKARVSIVGAGLMGHGIAQVFATHGYTVRIYDKFPAARERVLDKIRSNLDDLDQDTSAVERVIPSADLRETVADADFVFEAGPEDLALKQELFQEIEASAPRYALLASNTSVIPIGRIMSRLERPQRALGTHWWNPPYLVPLVEVIRTEHTDAAAVETMSQLLLSVGKTPVTVHKDVPGFVGNRLQHALWREAIALVQEGVCDAETVDTVVKASFGRRLGVLGPLENADLVGTDLTLAIHANVLPDLDRTPGPLPYLRELVESGRLGMKSGEGFRKWTEQEQLELRGRVLRHLKRVADEESSSAH